MGNCDSCLDGVRTLIIGQTPEEILTSKLNTPIHTPRVAFARELGRADSVGVNATVDKKACLDLMERARKGDVEGVRYLLKRACVDVNFADETYFGFTPLHVAAAQGHYEVVRMLLEQESVVVDARSQSGQTPVIMAARPRHMKTVNLLTAAGASLDAKPDHGSMSKSARDYMIEAANEGGEEAKPREKVVPIKALKQTRVTSSFCLNTGATVELKDPCEAPALPHVKYANLKTPESVVKVSGG